MPRNLYYTGEKEISQRSKFTVKKKSALLYADSLRRIGEKNRADRVARCGSVLTFAESDHNKSTLVGANFCRDRLCPMCTWRNSLKVFAELSWVMDHAMSGNDLQPIFLTLTVKNVAGDQLNETLRKMAEGWNRLFTGKGYKSNFLGWFRAVEVTYNKKDGTYHPHYHVLILAKKEYFTGKGYKTTEEWSKAWRRAARLDHAPVCHVQRVKNKAGADYDTTGRKAYAEVAKYTVKTTDYIRGNANETDAVVEVLTRALAGKRLYAYGGALKLLAKQYEEEQKEEKKLRADLQELIITYRWNIGAGRYERIEESRV